MIGGTCLYIAGTLFAIGTNDAAVPIGPNSMVTDYPTYVVVMGGGGQTQLPKVGVQSLADVLTQCDEQASRAVMERDEW